MRGRVVSASGSETSVSGSTPASAMIYDAYTSIKKKKKNLNNHNNAKHTLGLQIKTKMAVISLKNPKF